MSAEIESLSSDKSSRRTGGGLSPMLVVLAIVGLGLAIWAHWRLSHFDDRADRLHRQLLDMRAAQDRLAMQISTLSTRLETSQTAIRSELRSLQELPAQMAVLGRGVEELKARAEAPQRAWARAEALYLLDLADRQLNLDRDVGTAIAAMEAADARLAAFHDPAMVEVRRLLAQDLAALRAVPRPDFPKVIARISALEDAAPRMPVLGVMAGRMSPPPHESQVTGTFQRALRRVVEALSGLVTLQRVDPTSSRLVTQEEQSLLRQHLELLLFSVRVAAMQPNGTAYEQSLAAASEWLTRFFDASSPEVQAAQAEIAALRNISVEPRKAQIGAAARQLQLVMSGGASAP